MASVALMPTFELGLSTLNAHYQTAQPLFGAIPPGDGTWRPGLEDVSQDGTQTLYVRCGQEMVAVKRYTERFRLGIWLYQQATDIPGLLMLLFPGDPLRMYASTQAKTAHIRPMLPDQAAAMVPAGFLVRIEQILNRP
jgi:hypothetical protein